MALGMETSTMSSQITVTKWIWDFTAQSGHAMAGYIVVTKVKQHHGMHAALIAAAVGTVASAMKEFWYDQNYETVDTRGSNLLDFSMYEIGIIAGLLF